MGWGALKRGLERPGPESDRQTGAAALAAGTDHAAAGVAAHPHPETGDALALTAGSFEGAFGHGLISAAASWAIHHTIRVSEACSIGADINDPASEVARDGYVPRCLS